MKDLVKAPFAVVKQSYARFETIERRDGQIRGCWADSFSKACSETEVSVIETASVSLEQSPGNCSDGQLMWLITHS
jgi:hypothetical protein